MVDLRIIEDEIAALEYEGGTDFDTCEKLAMLYTVRDHLGASEPVEVEGSSDFLKACNGKNVSKVLEIVDDLMDVQKLLYPKAYGEIMEKVRAL